MFSMAAEWVYFSWSHRFGTTALYMNTISLNVMDSCLFMWNVLKSLSWHAKMANISALTFWEYFNLWHVFLEHTQKKNNDTENTDLVGNIAAWWVDYIMYISSG